MRYLFLATVCLVLLFATSCNKNDGTPALGSRVDSMTYRKVSDNSVVGGTKFKYDNAGNLVQYFSQNFLSTQFTYDSQNRLITFSSFLPNNPTKVDSLVYGTNSQKNYVYERIVGVNTISLAHTLVYDSKNRLIADTFYNSLSVPIGYYRFGYSSNDDLLSQELFGSYGNAGNVNYYRQDSTVFTHDANENPFYKNRSANYLIGSTIYPLSKHNPISKAVFYGTSTQTTNFGPYTLTYFKNGLLSSIILGKSTLPNISRVELLYQ